MGGVCLPSVGGASVCGWVWACVTVRVSEGGLIWVRYLGDPGELLAWFWRSRGWWLVSSGKGHRFSFGSVWVPGSGTLWVHILGSGFWGLGVWFGSRVGLGLGLHITPLW